MPVEFEQNETRGLIRFDGDVTIDIAAEVKDLLLQSLASAQETRVNMERATRLDLSIYQLLWAAERTTQQTGKKISLDGTVPDAILASFKHALVTKFPLS